MNQFPKISVVCPTYNSEKFIIDTLSTVLRQTVSPFELIISDDGSVDNTISEVETFFKSCKGFHTHLIKNIHKGAGAARNAGILKAKGDWVAFLDSDDLWAPKKIYKVSEIIQTQKDYNFIFHNEEHWKLDGSISLLHDFSSFYQQDESLILQVWYYCIFHTSSVTCRRNLLLECGLFNEDLMSSQDWELWIRMSPYMRFYHLREVLGTYIDRSDNITSKKSFKGLLDRLKIMSMHWSMSGASVWDYAYMAIRRIVGFTLKEIKII